MYRERAGQIVDPAGKPRKIGVDVCNVAERAGKRSFQPRQPGILIGKQRAVRIDPCAQPIQIGGERRNSGRVGIGLCNLRIEASADAAHHSRQLRDIGLERDDRPIERCQARIVIRQKRGVYRDSCRVIGGIAAQHGQIDIDPSDIGEQSGAFDLSRILFGLDTLDPRGEHVDLQIEIADRQQLPRRRRGKGQRCCHGRNRNSILVPHGPTPTSSKRRMQNRRFNRLDVA